MTHAAWDGIVSAKDFVRGTWALKLGISELSQRFLSQSKESKGFLPHETTLGQPEFLGLLGTWVQATVPEIREFCHGTQIPRDPSPIAHP